MKKQNILIAKGIVYITAAFTLSGCSENFLAQDPLSFYELHYLYHRGRTSGSIGCL